jgi:hypothetical protein
MHIGITTRFNYRFFSNGLYQNIILLYEILESAGHKVFYIDFCDDSEKIVDTNFEKECLANKNIINYKDLTPIKHHFDLICTPGIACNPEHKEKYKKISPNCKIVSIHYGNTLVTDICNHLCEAKSRGNWGVEPEQKYHDAALFSPHYKFQEQYLQINQSERTFEIPYLWDEKFIIGSARELGIECLKFKPQKQNNIAVTEPNINFSKTFIPPLFTIKHLLEHDPEIFNKAIFFGTDKIIKQKDNLFKSRILGDRVLKKHIKKMIFDPRELVAKIFDRDNPMFLSHQHLNALNYTYLEAAYFGYPLIHNSEFIKDFGYYYEEFNMIDAAEQIKIATSIHADYLENQISNGRELCWNYSVKNPEVIKATSDLFEKI